MISACLACYNNKKIAFARTLNSTLKSSFGSFVAFACFTEACSRAGVCCYNWGLHLRKVTSKPAQTDRFPPSDAAGVVVLLLCQQTVHSHWRAMVIWAGLPYSIHTFRLQAIWDRDCLFIQTILLQGR